MEAVRLPARVLQRGAGGRCQQARGVPAAAGAHRVGDVPVPGDQRPLPAHRRGRHAAKHSGGINKITLEDQFMVILD